MKENHHNTYEEAKRLPKKLPFQVRKRLLEETDMEDNGITAPPAQQISETLQFSENLKANLRKRGVPVDSDLATLWIREARDNR